LKRLIKPVIQDEEFLAEVLSKKGDSEHFHLWWLGQSGYLLKWQGHHLLIDPYLSDSLTEKYKNTDKPHIRLSELVVRPEKLDFIDLVTSSHDHTDHLDGVTLKALIRVNPDLKMIIPEANRKFVSERIEEFPDFPIGLNDGESVETSGYRITAIPASHNELERDEQGKCKFLGYIFQMGPWTIYHSGDTLGHEEIIRALGPFSIDLAILPINGNKPERRVAGNLDCNEAVTLSKAIGAKITIPCHYDMFTFNTEDPEKFRKAAELRGQRHVILPLGGYFSSEMI